MPAREMVLPEWVERISKGVSKGGMICMEATEPCQIQQRPGPGFATLYTATQGLQDADDATRG